MELRWADDVLRFELEPDGQVGQGGQGCLLGLTVTWQPTERWRIVHRADVERLGPEASAIGPPEDQ